MSEPLWAYWNDELVPVTQIGLPLSGSATLYGESLFETMRAYGDVVFRLDAHLQRLVRAAERLGMPLLLPGARPLTRNDLAAAVHRVVGENRPGVVASHGEAVDLRIRLTLWRRNEGESDVTVTAVPYQTPGPGARQQGLRVVTATPRVDPLSPLAGMKTGNYLCFLWASREARAAEADEAILLTVSGTVAEGSRTNIFLVQDGRLVTPDVTTSGAIPGIARSVVLGNARAQGVSVEERSVLPAELAEADEAFVTNSLLEVMPVTSLDGQPIGAGVPGPVTRRAAQTYRQTVAAETA